MALDDTGSHKRLATCRGCGTLIVWWVPVSWGGSVSPERCRLASLRRIIDLCCECTAAAFSGNDGGPVH